MGHDGEMRPDKWEISLALASSTLHTTAEDLAQFGVHLISGILDEAYFHEMAEPAVEVGANEEWEVSRGLGLAIATSAEGTYVYHGGNNVIFIADFVYGFEENLGYALLTNSANGSAMVEAVEQRIYGRDLVRP
jgi:hypothetical protein